MKLEPQWRFLIGTIVSSVMLAAMLVFFIFAFSSCTLSMNMVSTEGKASDVVDENQAASPNISTSVPLSLTK